MRYDNKNPSIKIRNAIIFINYRIIKLCNSLNVDFSQVETWLIEKHSDNYKQTEKLFQAIDNNIYGKWLEGKVQEFELKAWASVLTQWRESWIELLKQYFQDHQK